MRLNLGMGSHRDLIDDPKLFLRFWSKVVFGPSCWEWIGCRARNGYGHFQVDQKVRKAHRLAYEWMIGPVPVGLELDHLCRVRHCVNPAHLEPVTHRENRMRGQFWQDRPQCKHGHPWDVANTYVYPNGERGCRACHRDSAHRWRLKTPRALRA